jgi:hypothetical protein
VKRWLVLPVVAALMLALWSQVGQVVYVQIMTATSAAACWVFVALYGARSPWRRNQVGRSIMWLALSLALILTLISTSFLFGAYPGRDLVRNLIYSSLPVALVQFTRVLVRVQQGRERGEIPARVSGDL